MLHKIRHTWYISLLVASTDGTGQRVAKWAMAASADCAGPTHEMVEQCGINGNQLNLLFLLFSLSWECIQRRMCNSYGIKGAADLKKYTLDFLFALGSLSLSFVKWISSSSIWSSLQYEVELEKGSLEQFWRPE
jgi:hypothetical protein